MNEKANDYRKRWEEWGKTILLHLKNQFQNKVGKNHWRHTKMNEK